MKTRLCNKCQLHLPILKFGKDKNQKNGITFYCRKCINEHVRSYFKAHKNVGINFKIKYRKNKRKYRNWELKRNFGITINDYEKMVDDQNGVCKICKQPETSRNRKTLSVDHNHKTKIIRGLLCSNCNVGLGNFQDNIRSLKNAIVYLEDSNV